MNFISNYMKTSIFLLLFVNVLVFSLACDEPTNKTADEALSCVINSDCPLAQRCLNGVCTETVLVAECEGEECDCLSDLDCPDRSYCESETRRCTRIECELNSDCELGLVCIGRRCLIDLEADQDRDGIPDNADNCPMTLNPSQKNTDLELEGTATGPLLGDDLGDACDDDIDNDGVLNDDDNCRRFIIQTNVTAITMEREMV